MRALFAACVLLVGCSKNEEPTPTASTQKSDTGGGAPAQPQPAVKRPVDKTPLPKLSADPGGASGKALWGVGFGGLDTENPRSIAVGADGSVYIAGYFDGKSQFGATKLEAPQLDPSDPLAGVYKNKAGRMRPTSDAFVAKISADGKPAWVRAWGGPRDDDAKAVAVSGDTVVVVGNFSDKIELGAQLVREGHGSDDMFVAGFELDGTPKWVWTTGGPDSDRATAVAATPDGGWVIGGDFTKDVEFFNAKLTSRGKSDAVLIKLDHGGKLEWIKQLGGTQEDMIANLAVDGKGSIYVQGLFRIKTNWGGGDLVAQGADMDLVLAKFDLNGDHVWSKAFGTNAEELAGGIAVDQAGNTVMVGGFERTISFGENDTHTAKGADMFVARFDTNGTLQWARSYGGDRDDAAMGVALDASGNAVVSGWFVNTVDFGWKTLESKNHNKDVVAFKIDTKGNPMWVNQWGDKDHDQGRAVAMDAQGHAYVTGIFRFAFDAVSPALESVHGEEPLPKPDGFVVKLDR